jgi:hypothetical protein|tara:strand:- start:1030 stop:1155 length:126 start_codon:yes stop_codon:yes gene_type:complete
MEELAIKIIEAVNKTTNDYDAREIVVKIINNNTHLIQTLNK